MDANQLDQDVATKNGLDALLKKNDGLVMNSLHNNDDDCLPSIDEGRELRPLGYNEFMLLCNSIHISYKNNNKLE